MTKLTTTQARRKFGDLINEVAYGKAQVAIVRRGRHMAFIIPPEDYAVLEAAQDAADGARAMRVLRSPKTKWRSLADVKRRLARKPAENAAENAVDGLKH